MTRAEKTTAIEELKQSFQDNQYFYITDSSALTVEQVNNLRRLCHEKGVTMKVVKNTLAKKALEAIGEDGHYSELWDALKGPTAVMFSETANVTAKLIKEFREKHDKPILKAAYIDTDVFLGDDQLDVLKSLKSKEELIGEIVILLQSPIKNLVGSLNSGSSTIAGLVKALEERASA